VPAATSATQVTSCWLIKLLLASKLIFAYSDWSQLPSR